MGPLVDLLEVGNGDFGVNAGGFEPGVAKERLDETDVGPVLVHVRGAGMTKQVAASGFADLGRVDGAGDPVAEVAGAEALPVATEEEGLLGVVQDEAWPGLFEVAGEPLQGALPHRDEAVLSSLAAEVEGSSGPVEVGKIEAHDLTAPRCGRVEGFEDSTVTDAEGVAHVGHGHERGDFFASESSG